MAGLEGDMQVPGAGKVSRKAAAGGVIVVFVLVVVYYVRKKSASSASSAAATAATAATPSDQYPADGTTGNPQDPYSTDPATGTTYGNEASGSGGAYGAYGSGAASGLYYDPATGAYDLTSPYGTTPSGSAGGPPFANNSAWSIWVIGQLQAVNYSIDTGALTNAIGLYLDGQALDAAQRQYVFDATAIGGDPPVAGPNNYPPNVRSVPSGTTHTKVTVPDVVGEALVTAQQNMTYAGLKSHAAGPAFHSPEVRVVTKQSEKAGAQVDKGTTVDLTYDISGGAKKPAAHQDTVPDVVGKDLVTAQQDMARAGFRSTASGPKFTAGHGTRVVVSQSAKAGSKWQAGTNVVLKYTVK